MNAPETLRPLLGHSEIAITDIAPSPTNPRKRFAPEAMAELTESVKKHGVIQPILIRPLVKGKTLYELVAGERRYRAAKAAGLATIPAIARELTDVEALELQVIENLQRQDLHPLEEAEGYEVLMKQHHYTADDLAAKLGKSRGYVYARLKLLALTTKGRDAFFAGALNPSVALLVARIPVPKLQDEALKEITNPHSHVRSVRDIEHYLQQHYMLRLSEAPFPPADADLIADVGSCAACPKRTGNQPELFGDVKSKDVCTDPVCFTRKKDAHIERARAAAEAKGQKVITGDAARKIIPYNTVDHGSGYVDLNAKNYEDAKQRTNRQILGKDAPEPVLVEHPETGKFVEVVPKKALKEKLPQRPVNDSTKQADATARLETKINTRIFEEIATKHPGTMQPADAALIAAALFDRTDHEGCKRVLPLWEPEAAAKAKDHQLWGLKDKFAKRIATMSPKELALLMVQLALVNDVHVSSYDNRRKATSLIAVAERIGVDHAAIRKELQGAVKAKASKASPQKKPAPKKKTATKKGATKSDATEAA